jgi:hypothetical protein
MWKESRNKMEGSSLVSVGFTVGRVRTNSPIERMMSSNGRKNRKEQDAVRNVGKGSIGLSANVPSIIRGFGKILTTLPRYLFSKRYNFFGACPLPSSESFNRS